MTHKNKPIENFAKRSLLGMEVATAFVFRSDLAQETPEPVADDVEVIEGSWV